LNIIEEGHVQLSAKIDISRAWRGFAGIAALLFATSALAQSPAAKTVGAVKSVTGNSVIIASDSGVESTVTVADAARILKAAPGQTDLKSATAIQVSDIQVGDRILARGQSANNGALVASLVVVMGKSDIAQKQQSERDAWRRGVGGIVKSIDASSGAITLANSLAAAGKPIVVHVTPQTSVKRYAPDSVKFDEAQPGTIDQIKPGDQLRGRGTRNADGTEFNAQAIVSGAFRDVAGMVISTDAANNSVTVMDLATKKPLAVRVSSDSQLRKLPPLVASRLALRLKGGAPGSNGQGSNGQSANGDAGGQASGGVNAPVGGGSYGRGQAGAGNGGGQAGRGGPGEGGGIGRGGNSGDFQQLLSRMPALSISDLNKGDAVMLVATQGSATSQPTVITMISGVEPILTASPGAGASLILSPWNLGGGGEGGGEAATP
jgi:hypothetical protein